MSNISDYLDWRGDMPLSLDGFNEVDNLILAELAYTRFDGIVPGPETDKRISIREARDKFFEMHSEEEIMNTVSSVKVAPFLMNKMVDSKRFGDVEIGAYVSNTDEETQTQFSAVAFYLPDGSIYIAYRGTDSSMVGWKEDFNMGFVAHLPGQKMAAEYLNKNFSDTLRHLRVGGHSKGGNLAVYAAAFCDEKVQRKIDVVYSNDGPGFLEEITLEPGYRKMLPKVVSTIPEFSIVGYLLENKLEHKTVKTNQVGAYQHDAMSWEVLGNHFVESDTRAGGSKIIDNALHDWLKGLDAESREVFADVLFAILRAGGADTVDEFTNANTLKWLADAKALIQTMPQEHQKSFKEAVMKLAKSSGQAIVSELFTETKNNLLKGIEKNN